MQAIQQVGVQVGHQTGAAYIEGSGGIGEGWQASHRLVLAEGEVLGVIVVRQAVQGAMVGCIAQPHPVGPFSHLSIGAALRQAVGGGDGQGDVSRETATAQTGAGNDASDVAIPRCRLGTFPDIAAAVPLGNVAVAAALRQTVRLAEAELPA